VGAFILVHKTLGDGASRAFVPEILDAMEILAGLTAVAVQSAELKDSQQNFFTHTIEIVVTALNAHIGDRTGGVHRVAQLANRIGRELGLEDEALRRLHFSSLLCDIGMLKLSSAQLKSPKHLAKHAVLGHRMLSRIRMWEMLADIVLHHHDRFDDGQRASGPLESQIIQVAEALSCSSGDEVTTPTQRLVDLAADSGGRFDPSVVSAVERLVKRGELGD
jgi:response regulator RpfG family c-di-GMP phosphodiesterase